MIRSVWVSLVDFISALKYRIISSFVHLLSIRRVHGIVWDTDYILLTKQKTHTYSAYTFARKKGLLRTRGPCGLFKSKAIIFYLDKFYHRNKHTNKTGKNIFQTDNNADPCWIIFPPRWLFLYKLFLHSSSFTSFYALEMRFCTSSGEKKWRGNKPQRSRGQIT